MIKRWMVTAFLLSAAVDSGIAQESRMVLQNIATGGIDLPPNTTATDLPIVLEEGPAGGGTVEVSTRDIAVQIALVMPSGIEVAAANAASLGFGYQRFDLRGQQS